MLHHILHEFEWGIAFVVLTLILFLIIALVTIQPVIATITEGDIAPGQSYCRIDRVVYCIRYALSPTKLKLAREPDR